MKPASVTLGVFDGVHRGHEQVLHRARLRAEAGGVPLVVMTFEPRPQAVLSGVSLPLLSPLEERVRRLQDRGADDVRVLRFDRGMADASPVEFLERFVFSSFRMLSLTVGYDFAMGRNRSGSVPVLRSLGERLGFTVEGVAAVLDAGVPISSTRIRRCLEVGDVDEAARLLGRPHELSGRVISGEGRGRTLGYPTANLDVDSGLARPGHGVYAARVRGKDLEETPAVVNLGVRPTFSEGRETLEIHLLDFQGRLEGRCLTVSWVRRLRPERKFNSANELQNQIARDVASARAALAPST